MALTLKRKITSGLVAIVAIGIVSMLIVYAGLLHLQQTVHLLTDVRAPMVAAAYEMEINLWGQGMAVLDYLQRRDPRQRERVAKDQADFERFYEQFARLADSERARVLARRLRDEYERFRTLGTGMMDQRDQQDQLSEAALGNFERIDTIIQSERTAARAARGSRGDLETLVAMEADVAELSLWMANYRRGDRDGQRGDIDRRLKELETSLANFKRRVAPRSDGSRAVTRLAQEFERVISGLVQIAATERRLQSDSETFSVLRTAMDDLIDDEIQAEAVSDLSALRLADARATQSVIVVATLVMPTYIIAAAFAGVMLVRSITEPVQRLIAGAGAVRQGDLSHRIPPTGDSELSNLAREFNRMVAELEGTTVSKASLEHSQMRLREVVRELSRETADRERVEEERTRLQAALRRSEVLSALGSIVAGVSHEVRNPLFAISSTLDALEARLRNDQSGALYQQHMQVLRVELERLTKLMQDLLEYGKPQSLNVADNSVVETVNASVAACQSVATSAGTTIVTRIEPGVDSWPMDRGRIEQVLRNLLENAIQHTPNGTVSLDVRSPLRDGAAYLQMHVRDEGPGFDAAQLPHVFEPFFSRRSGGTGLGLSIVERIVLAHGGVVRAASRPSGGAEITLDLPRPPRRGAGPELGGAA